MGDLSSLLDIANHAELKIRNCRRVSRVCVSQDSQGAFFQNWSLLALMGAQAASPPSYLPWRRMGGSNNPFGWKLKAWKTKVEEEGKVVRALQLWKKMKEL